MASKKTSQNALAALAAIPNNMNGYSAEGQANKDTLHKQGAAFLKRLAGDLGLGKGDFDIRSNLGGIAVSGEVTLHADNLYVQLSDSSFGGFGVRVLYRSCTGRDDYIGDRNNYTDVAALNEGAYPGFVAQCATLMKHGANLEQVKRASLASP